MSQKSIFKVPFFVPELGNDEDQAVLSVMRSKWLTSGEQSIKFESEFRNFVDCEYAVSVSSCSAALILALEALNIPAGSEVIVPSLTFVSTVNSILHCGLVPVFVDVEYDTHNISLEALESKISLNTKAIIAVHFAGAPCDLLELRLFCDRYSLYLIEDAAHALPAQYKDSKIGSCQFSDITCFSFYSNKTLTTGEGGMVTTNNIKIAEAVELLRSHCMDRHAWNRFSQQSKTWKYDISGLGHKFNLSDLNAAIGRIQLTKQNKFAEKRTKAETAYRKILEGLDYLELTKQFPKNKSACHLFQIKVENRDNLFDYLKSQGISCSVHYTPVHLMTYYQHISKNINSLKNTEKIGARVLSLPLYPSINNEEIEYVCNRIMKYYE